MNNSDCVSCFTLILYQTNINGSIRGDWGGSLNNGFIIITRYSFNVKI